MSVGLMNMSHEVDVKTVVNFTIGRGYDDRRDEPEGTVFDGEITWLKPEGSAGPALSQDKKPAAGECDKPHGPMVTQVTEHFFPLCEHDLGRSTTQCRRKGNVQNQEC